MQETINILKTIADPVRLRIISLLSKQELCVCQIEKVLNMSQSRISNNMAKLKNANLITDRQEGKWKHYSLTKEGEIFLQAPLSDTIENLQKKEPLKSDLTNIKNKC